MRHTYSIVVGLLFSILLMTGCSHRMAAADDPNGEWVPIHETAAQGQVHLNSIEVGMTRDQVLKIMGTKTHYGKRPHRAPTIIPHPSRREVVKEGEKEYEILYYYTKYAKGDKSLTPIILTNGSVSGWGWNYLNSALKRAQ